jgi:hypothetical protein
MNPIKSAIIQNSRYGVKDRCLSFDGTDDYMNLNINFISILDGLSAISVEFLVYQSVIRDGTDRNQIFALVINNGGGAFLEAHFRGTLLYYGGRSQVSDSYSGTNKDVGVLQVWQHIAIVINYANAKLKLFINGIEIAEHEHSWGSTTIVDPKDITVYDAIAATYAPAPDPISSGNYDKRMFNGKIDEFRIWNHARTADQIKRYMNTRLYGTETGLVAYYPMDEGTGSTAFDKSTNSNNGTIIGATWIKP